MRQDDRYLDSRDPHEDQRYHARDLWWIQQSVDLKDEQADGSWRLLSKR